MIKQLGKETITLIIKTDRDLNDLNHENLLQFTFDNAEALANCNNLTFEFKVICNEDEKVIADCDNDIPYCTSSEYDYSDC